MMKGPPPPRPSGDLGAWARKVTDYLLSMQIERQRPTPIAPQLLYLAEVQESAARDGVMLFDNERSVPVVSQGQEFKRVAMEEQTPQIVAVPATATSAGVAGQIAWDADYVYFCTTTDTWVRVALATW